MPRDDPAQKVSTATLKVTFENGTACVVEFTYSTTPDAGSFVLSGDGTDWMRELLGRFEGTTAFSRWSGLDVATTSSWAWWSQFAGRLMLMGIATDVVTAGAPSPPPRRPDPVIEAKDIPDHLWPTRGRQRRNDGGSQGPPAATETRSQRIEHTSGRARVATLRLTWPDGSVCVCGFEYDDDPDAGRYRLSGDGAERMAELIEESQDERAYSAWKSWYVSNPTSWSWLHQFFDRLVRFEHAASLEVIEPPPPPSATTPRRLDPSDLPASLLARRPR